MRISLPKYSRWISLVMLVVISAGINAQSGGVNPDQYTTGQYVYQKATCKATVNFHGQELAGRMIFKRTAEDTVLVAFFNELGVSYVEGCMVVGSRESGVRSLRNANRELRNANRFDFVKLAPFLEYKSFRKNFEKGMLELLVDDGTGLIELPENKGEIEEVIIYKKGRKFQLGLRL